MRLRFDRKQLKISSEKAKMVLPLSERQLRIKSIEAEKQKVSLEIPRRRAGSSADVSARTSIQIFHLAGRSMER